MTLRSPSFSWSHVRIPIHVETYHKYSIILPLQLCLYHALFPIYFHLFFGLSRCVVCVILRLAVSIQYRRVTDRHTYTQTDRPTTTANTRIAIAPRGGTGKKHIKIHKNASFSLKIIKNLLCWGPLPPGGLRRLGFRRRVKKSKKRPCTDRL